MTSTTHIGAGDPAPDDRTLDGHLSDGSARGLATVPTADQRLYEKIFEAIITQRLMPGTKLIEDELATIFSVSRSVVRRALLRLSQDRIVDMRPNRGATVAAPGVEQAREVFAARRLIEREVVAEAMQRTSPEQLAVLRELVDEELHNRRERRNSSIRLSGNFHIALAELSGNSTLAKFVRELVPQTSLIIAQYEHPAHSACPHDEHAELLDVMLGGNIEEAVALMDRHLLHIEHNLDLDGQGKAQDLRSVFADML